MNQEDFSRVRKFSEIHHPFFRVFKNLSLYLCVICCEALKCLYGTTQWGKLNGHAFFWNCQSISRSVEQVFPKPMSQIFDKENFCF